MHGTTIRFIINFCIEENPFWDMAPHYMFFENIGNSYQNVHRHGPEDSFNFRHRWENLKSYNFNITFCTGGD